jgi:poly-gamma-glutamate synthesis protein (capsule biosynthesis protein)
MAGCFAIAALAACSSGGKPARTDIMLSGDTPLVDSAVPIAQQALEGTGLKVGLSLGGAGDIALNGEPSTDKHATNVVVRYWVAAAQLQSPSSDVSMVELGDAVAQESAKWSRVIVRDDVRPPFEQWWPDATVDVVPVAPDDVPATLAADPKAIAIIPLDDVDVRVRALTVDGVNVVFGSGEFSSYGLVERQSIQTNHSGDKRFDDAVDKTVTAIVSALTALSPDPIIMRVTGDIIPARCALAKIQSYGDYKHPFLQLGPWLKQADITVGSLDSSLADVSPPWPCVDTFNLAAPSAAIEGLTYSGFDVITNAANHAMDCGQVGACGPEALLETNANLRKNGIQPVGSGAGLAEARTPVIVTSKGVRFAFLGYDDIQALYHAEPGVAGTAPLEEAYVREDVAAAAAQADVVIVMPHWGIEYQAEPTDRQRTIARAAVESGAGLVLGNHPHWVEANEIIDGSFVEYALGNFVFDQDWSLATQQGAVLEVAFAPDGRGGAQLKGVRYYAVHIWDQNQPRLAEPAEAQQILDRIWNASAALR